MACGCKKRMAALEQKAPKVAEVIRPAHEAAMKAMDRVSVLRAGRSKPRVIGRPIPPSED